MHIQWYSRLCTITCITSLTLFISRLGSDQTKPIPERRSNQKVPTHFKVQSFDQGDLATLMLTKRVSISNTKKVFGDITSMWGKIYTTKSSHYIHFIPLQQMNIDFFPNHLENLLICTSLDQRSFQNENLDITICHQNLIQSDSIFYILWLRYIKYSNFIDTYLAK